MAVPLFRLFLQQARLLRVTTGSQEDEREKPSANRTRIHEWPPPAQRAASIGAFVYSCVIRGRLPPTSCAVAVRPICQKPLDNPCRS